MTSKAFAFPLSAKTVRVSASGELGIIPSAASAKNDYDFLLGKHTVHHKKLKERFSGSTEWIDIHGSKETEQLLNGTSNIEKHFLYDMNGNPLDAFALRLFNPETRLWSLYWADEIFGTLDNPLQGSFENDLGIFFGRDTFNGKGILVQFQYDRTNPDNPVWGQAFSNDNGATWEWNWFMFFKKN